MCFASLKPQPLDPTIFGFLLLLKKEHRRNQMLQIGVCKAKFARMKPAFFDFYISNTYT